MPAEVTASRTTADWGRIVQRLDLLAFDMQHHLGLRLTTVLRTHTWREFAHLVSGLLGLEEHIVTGRGVTSIPASLLGAHFHTPDDEEPADE
ncbi:hypothetical protein [Curtobacterium sp. MCBA15_012]|uniref:hypothetical protein n=1 Tax=Curtobacterium sp. MCBA15_012 TaxID=1898738 RepID=UPI0008DDBE6E|nr:hypothetical protein [Curtobacterium sp. MCBA15_012]WIA99748.1 hypothetical protein QOL15_14735 [Curtobacterium sp. MCBA15_012]